MSSAQENEHNPPHAGDDLIAEEDVPVSLIPLTKIKYRIQRLIQYLGK